MYTKLGVPSDAAAPWTLKVDVRAVVGRSPEHGEHRDDSVGMVVPSLDDQLPELNVPRTAGDHHDGCSRVPIRVDAVTNKRIDVEGAAQRVRAGEVDEPVPDGHQSARGLNPADVGHHGPDKRIQRDIETQ